jgi:hypothetical protein
LVAGKHLPHLTFGTPRTNLGMFAHHKRAKSPKKNPPALFWHIRPPSLIISPPLVASTPAKPPPLASPVASQHASRFLRRLRSSLTTSARLRPLPWPPRLLRARIYLLHCLSDSKRCRSYSLIPVLPVPLLEIRAPA